MRALFAADYESSTPSSGLLTVHPGAASLTSKFCERWCCVRSSTDSRLGLGSVESTALNLLWPSSNSCGWINKVSVSLLSGHSLQYSNFLVEQNLKSFRSKSFVTILLHGLFLDSDSGSAKSGLYLGQGRVCLGT